MARKTNSVLIYALLAPLKAGVLFALVTSLIILPAAQVRADSFDDQIRALQQEVARFQDQASALRAKASSLQAELSALQAEMAVLQNQINLKEAELAKINDTIVKTEQRLENQKLLLAGNLRAMYLDSRVSPLEMVASSKSISDFIDKQEYRNKIREQVQRNIADIRKLKEELAAQKKEAERVLADQKQQQADLQAKRSEQATLLAQTQGQEAAYQRLSSERNSQISSLRAQQAAANRRNGGTIVPGDPNRGGYPWWNTNPFPTYSIDNWGMYKRQCVSFTAWKVYQSGKHMPYWGGRGDANKWDDNARREGIPTSSQPKAGTVAIDNSGPYGHAMWVEAVLGNGQIYVSQYNYGWNGEYSEMTRSASGLVYIDFE